MDITGANREIIYLTRWLFPAIIFICLYGLNTAVLHCYDTFFVPSVAPIVCNSAWIIGAIFLKSYNPELAMPMLAKFVVIGFIGQWLWTYPLVARQVSKSIKQKMSFTIPYEVKQLFKSFSLGAIGVGAIQINSFADALFARYAHVSGPVYLWYSIRFQQLAIALLGIACISTVMPSLSRAIKKKQLDEARSLFSFSYQRILLIMTLCTFGIFALGGSSINLVFGRGNFSSEAVSQTSLCLFAYGIGLIPATMIILYSSLFYSNHDFKTPTLFSVISVGTNLILNALFVFIFNLGPISIAIATSISAWVNYLLLQRASKKMSFTGGYSFSKICSLFSIGIGSFCVALLFDTYFLDQSIISLILGQTLVFPRLFFEQILQFLTQLSVFLISLISISKLLKNKDILETIKLFLPVRSSIKN